MKTKFTKEEVEELKKLLVDLPEVSKILDTLKELITLSRRWIYPISTYDDLLRLIEKEHLCTSSQVLRISDTPNLIPVDLFPIFNIEDYEYKIRTLYNKIKSDPLFTPNSLIYNYIPTDKSPAFPERLLKIKPKPSQPGILFEKIDDEL